MARKVLNSRAAVDPTIETTDIVIGDKVYRMCFDLGALAQAEDELTAKGYKINILDQLPRMNLSSTRILFAASLRKFHPEVSFEDGLNLLTLPYVYEAGQAIFRAWEKCLPKPEGGDKQNPIAPDR